MNAKVLSEYIINKCYTERKPVSNLKLQKILYFLYLAYYDKYKKALFSNRFSAWKLGAVIVDVYLDYSKYIANPICEQYSVKIDLPNNEIKFINETIEKLNSLDIWDLINQSKQSEYWKKAFEKGKGSIIDLPPNYQCRKSYK